MVLPLTDFRPCHDLAPDLMLEILRSPRRIGARGVIRHGARE